IGHAGVAGESDTVRIGGAQTRAFIAGIRGRTTAQSNAVAVLIDSAGQLGTISSSRRVKQDVDDMGVRTRGLFDLRPVTFRYISHAEAGSTALEYGLIAEEVAEVYPDLVVRNAAGEIETVQYHKLAPMLLNEVQRLERERAALEQRVAQQARELDELKDRVNRLVSGSRR
ncbi:MAG: tail fiber domain-containing protein, partial [Vicinamibacterales bacterium]